MAVANTVLISVPEQDGNNGHATVQRGATGDCTCTEENAHNDMSIVELGPAATELVSQHSAEQAQHGRLAHSDLHCPAKHNASTCAPESERMQV
jgi:hypothetical protein